MPQPVKGDKGAGGGGGLTPEPTWKELEKDDTTYFITDGPGIIGATLEMPKEKNETGQLGNGDVKEDGGDEGIRPLVARETNSRTSTTTTTTSDKIASSTCPCSKFNWGGKDASECCFRTDRGDAKWTETENGRTCAKNEHMPDACISWCPSHCGKVSHPDDKQGLVDYLGSKAGEILYMGKADVLLGTAATLVKASPGSVGPAMVPLKSMKSIHPVGSWRPDTWEKTKGRRDSMVAAKDVIMKTGGALTENLTNNDVPGVDASVLKPMRSIEGFIAVPFKYCGLENILLEGNGRLKGAHLAAEQDPELNNIQVEVALHSYSAWYLRQIHKSVAKLWAQYTAEALAMDPVKDAAQIMEYMTFKVGIIECIGIGVGSKNTECPIVSKLGQVPEGDNVRRWLPRKHLVGVRRAVVVSNDATRRWVRDILKGTDERSKQYSLEYWELCSETGEKEYLVSNPKGGGVFEYCNDCIDRGIS